MCIFSRHVDRVSNTNIFARDAMGGRQFIVYSMTVESHDELAMILPIPVPKASADDAVRFISLKDYPNFFEDLISGFPLPKPPKSRGLDSRSPPLELPKPLPVVTVGNFEASFVPTIREFARLDDRFRLPDTTWNSIPLYRDYGFAVFKLKTGEQRVHPMAFEFPRSNPGQIFFPTVHIHDEKVVPKAEFDHTLYCQSPNKSLGMQGWRESPQLVSQFMKMDKSQGLLDGSSHCYQRTVRGVQRNEDILV